MSITTASRRAHPSGPSRVKNARRSSRPRPRPTQSTRFVGTSTHDRGVAMPALDRELVDRDHAHRARGRSARAARSSAR